ncbi:MAG: 50S ribosomal protein L30 [Solirubrobacterales bacterium]
MAELLIKQVRSANGSSPRQRDTLRTLRLGRIGKSVVREDTEDLHGLLRKVDHLVTVEPAAAAGKES